MGNSSTDALFAEAIEKVNRRGLVDFLAELGYYPDKPIKHGKAWYKSMLPDRIEDTPSFVVYTNTNSWYDWGNGQGGDLIALGMKYYQCDFIEFMQRIEHIPFDSTAVVKKPLVPPPPAVKLLQVKPLTNPSLLFYAGTRFIPGELLKKRAYEVEYSIYDKKQFAIGLLNNSGGYELRNKYFKGNTNPKDSSYIKNGADKLVVFEGMFDYFTYLTLTKNRQDNPADYLILNSTSFFNKYLDLMNSFREVNLSLDNDPTGNRCIEIAYQSNSDGRTRFKDPRSHFSGWNDLNAWHVSKMKAEQHDRSEVNRPKMTQPR